MKSLLPIILVATCSMARADTHTVQSLHEMARLNRSEFIGYILGTADAAMRAKGLCPLGAGITEYSSAHAVKIELANAIAAGRGAEPAGPYVVKALRVLGNCR